MLLIWRSRRIIVLEWKLFLGWLNLRLQTLSLQGPLLLHTMTLEQEINRVTELGQNIEFKQGIHEDLRINISSSDDNNNKFVASKGTELRSGILETELMFIADTLARLQEKVLGMSGSAEKASMTTKNMSRFLNSIGCRPSIVKLNYGVNYRLNSIGF